MWKKKSRDGLPVVRNVGEQFSVKPITGSVFGVCCLFSVSGVIGKSGGDGSDSIWWTEIDGGPRSCGMVIADGG